MANALAEMSDIQDVMNLISYFIDPKTMRAIMYNCLRIDIPDNNMKARIAARILDATFTEIGTGTNRIAFKHNGVVVKIALDRRGLVDNFTEFKRSAELENQLARTYETNYLINISEYVEVLDQDEFFLNEGQIKQVLKNLAQNYIFDDIGFTDKNSYNWGKREAILTDEEKRIYGKDADSIYDVVILDYGYLYPLRGQRDRLMRCPKCHHPMAWNSAFTGLGCTSASCHYQCTPTQFLRHIKLDYEEVENQIIGSFANLQMPNLAKIEQAITKMHK